MDWWTFPGLKFEVLSCECREGGRDRQSEAWLTMPGKRRPALGTVLWHSVFMPVLAWHKIGEGGNAPATPATPAAKNFTFRPERAPGRVGKTSEGADDVDF